MGPIPTLTFQEPMVMKWPRGSELEQSVCEISGQWACQSWEFRKQPNVTYSESLNLLNKLLILTSQNFWKFSYMCNCVVNQVFLCTCSLTSLVAPDSENMKQSILKPLTWLTFSTYKLMRYHSHEPHLGFHALLCLGSLQERMLFWAGPTGVMRCYKSLHTEYLLDSLIKRH